MTGKLKAMFVVPPLGPGDFATQTDAVLARCAGIYTKTDYVVPPLGLAYVCAAVEAWAGAEVNLVDAVAGKDAVEETVDAITRFKPDILYAAAGTSTLRRDLRFLARCKDALPGLTTAVMGTHVTVLPGDAFVEPGADFGIRGEPERTAAELGVALSDGKPVEDVSGLAIKRNGSFKLTPDRPLITDLDEIPHPARRFFRPYVYSPPFTRGNRFDVLITSRGCPYRCNYCSTGAYYGKKIRFRSPADVVAELREMVEDEGVTQVGFWDDTFTIGKRRVMEICDRIEKSGLEFEWMCMSRVDTVDEETLAALRRAGCYLILYGVESGSQRVLDAMKKEITLAQVERAFEMTYDAGIEAAAFFMFGNLEETEEDIRATIEFAKKLKASFASFNIATPYPGTELYEMVKDELNTDMEGMNARRAVIGDKGLLESYISRAYREFYVRPSYVWRRLRRVRSAGEFFKVVKAGLDVLRLYVLG
jgi:anaerobic magnesium-protoporphyrin IX monomethyl ester cyclase